MSNVGYDTWFPKRPSTKFVVKNVTGETSKWGPKGKRVRVFAYPINNGETRDLLAIPGVSEADIRHSLLKGELQIKLDPSIRELIVVESDIDLLQFNAEQKAFLESVGITTGLEITGAEMVIPFIFKQNIILIGALDSVNRIFNTPDKFVDGTLGGNEFHILVRHNGVVLQKNVDYIISESGGVGTGFDTVFLVSFTPNIQSSIIADYIVRD